MVILYRRSLSSFERSLKSRKIPLYSVSWILVRHRLPQLDATGNRKSETMESLGPSLAISARERNDGQSRTTRARHVARSQDPPIALYPVPRILVHLDSMQPAATEARQWGIATYSYRDCLSKSLTGSTPERRILCPVSRILLSVRH